MAWPKSDARPTGDGGQRFGRYTVAKRIAIGGMAEVFLGRLSDGTGAETVVLKVLLPQHQESAELVQMLRHEAALNRLLRHPNLVEVLEVGEHEGQTFLVMEHVDGLSLAQVMEVLAARGDRMPLSCIAQVIGELLAALAFVHGSRNDDGESLHIVHRDVTPQNVLLDRRGRVVLGDFGIARSSLRDDRTRTGTIKGKLGYLAPEQVTGSNMDGRTDLYGVGVIFWELLTGVSYQPGKSEIERLKGAENPVFRPPSTAGAGESRCDALLARALARFPEERFADAAAMDRALRQVLTWDAESARDELGALVRQSASQPVIGSIDGPATERAGSSERATSAVPLDARPPTDSPAEPAADRAVGQSSFWRRFAVTAALAAALVVAWFAMRAEESEPEDPSTGPTAPREAVVATSGTPPGGDEPSPAGTASADGPASANKAPASAGVGHADGDEGSGDPAGRASGRQTAAAIPDQPAALSDLPATTTERRPRPVAVAEEPTDGVDPIPAATPTLDRRRIEALGARLATLRRSLAQRGILIADLSASTRAELTTLGETLRRSMASSTADAPPPQAVDLAAIELEIAALERTAAEIVIDGPFVQQKLVRVDRELAEARRTGRDTRPLERLSAMALQELLAGQYEATNRRLNELLQRLTALRAAP